MHNFLRNTVGPLFLILCCPPFVMLLWYTNTAMDGSFIKLWQLSIEQGIFSTLMQICGPLLFGSARAWMIIGIFILFQLALLHFVPGKIVSGPMTANGYTPQYKSNGPAAFFITVAAFLLGSYSGIFSASIIYDNFGYILGALNCLSLVVCFLLYLKGRFAPNSLDSGTSGNFIFDYYWGTELYPTIKSINIKMFINCRLGMMSWGIIIISYAAKQYEIAGLSNSMLISVLLQLIYITKFYFWEEGYLSSLDIMHDRAGFYICWGCLVWVPAVYTSASMYLVLHPINLSNPIAALILLAGVGCIMMNYMADRQRQLIRSTNGKCKIWGRDPTLIKADYRTINGESRQNLLLSSGWWGVSRHFHYLPEIMAAFFWSVPALFYNFSPYFYVCFLTVLLVDRAFRDDQRCALKYGSAWQEYCEQVPFKIIPFIV